MFNFDPDISRLLNISDECYSSDKDFKQTLDFLKYLALEQEDGEELSLSENFLIIDTKEGVFLRARDLKWCNTLKQLAENPKKEFIKFKPISYSDWNNITTRYRAPLQYYGDDKLARWRVGF